MAQIENEAEIVLQAVTDDRAFEILYNQYFPKIFGYIYKRVGHKEIAEDIVSATFMKVFTSLKEYKPGDYEYSFSAWIFKIATNKLIDHYRKKGRNPDPSNIDDLPEPNDPSQDPSKNAQFSYDRAMVQKIMVKLPEKYQKVLYLKYFAELDNIEIANTLGISANNVGVLLHRALKKFQEIHQKYAI